MAVTDSMLDTTDHLIDGVRCAVYDSAPDDRGEAVVFVHGVPGPMDDWAELAPEIAAFARVIAMDMPGYGRSQHPKSFDYSVKGYARFLGLLMDRLAIERAHLVLHDFGGLWGLRWALEHPQRLASLTLISTGVLDDGYRWHRLARIWQTPIVGELFQLASTPRTMKKGLDRVNPRPMPRAYVDRVGRYADWAHKRAVLRLYRDTPEPLSWFPERDFGAAAHVPVCVIWGAGDPYNPVRFAERQRNFFPDSEVHLLDGLGHWPFIDDPQAVRTPLTAFLREHVRA
ncbi:alpha/beta fold hydrolase [Nocardia sp. NPDC051321]|uniref:alpha/beta fold hydrolase n=1 Tax=Nocardia sp. NPDC051321 TaxID=3364323 RepID=UPI0037AA9D3D